MFESLNKTMLSFIISSSLPSFIITALYVGYGMSMNKESMSSIGAEWYMILIPLIYGIFGTLSYELGTLTNSWTNNTVIVAILGGLMGLLLSLIGRYYLSLPTKIFGMDGSNANSVHWKAIVLYLFIFVLIVNPLQKMLI
jgi:hypothetical protein